MRRTTITIPADVEPLLADTDPESMLRRALEEWLTEHGESTSVLRSEGGRIRVMLQVAAATLKERALDIGYHEIAVWWEGADHGRRAARDQAIRVETVRWGAEEAAATAVAPETGVGVGRSDG
jgi:hypothetical protein